MLKKILKALTPKIPKAPKGTVKRTKKGQPYVIQANGQARFIKR